LHKKYMTSFFKKTSYIMKSMDMSQA